MHASSRTNAGVSDSTIKGDWEEKELVCVDFVASPSVENKTAREREGTKLVSPFVLRSQFRLAFLSVKVSMRTDASAEAMTN